MDSPVNYEYDYKLTVLGEPLAQKRHRHASRGRDGRPLPFVKTYDPSAKDKRDLRRLVQAEAPDKPLLGPLRVDVFLFWPHLQSHYGTGRNAGKLKASAPQWKATKPDRDNADKIILDALQGVFWINDSQICDGRIVKRFAEKPRTEIYITQLEKNDDGKA
jgi:Holliday junction resolvase RusA-like endonuclease